MEGTKGVNGIASVRWVADEEIDRPVAMMVVHTGIGTESCRRSPALAMTRFAGKNHWDCSYHSFVHAAGILAG